jgi:drug/metabolite transporter (DMT)-like permease
MHIGVIYALAAAVLFGASTPFAKTLLTHMAPVSLAGVLYFGSGLGLLIWYGMRRLQQRHLNTAPIMAASPCATCPGCWARSPPAASPVRYC